MARIKEQLPFEVSNKGISVLTHRGRHTCEDHIVPCVTSRNIYVAGWMSPGKILIYLSNGYTESSLYRSGVIDDIMDAYYVFNIVRPTVSICGSI